MATILIKNGRVWDGEKFFYADVLSVGKVIEKIEPNIDAKADFTFDASGKIVSVGLIDLHTHLRGISCEAFGTPAEISCFPFGVTAAVDAGGTHGTKELLDSFMLKSVVFVTAGIWNNDMNQNQVQARLDLFKEKALGIKVYFDTTQNDAVDTTPLKHICDFAHERGLNVMVHCAYSPVKMADILDTLGEGDILTHSFHGAPNTAEEDNFESMKRAKARGVIIDVGFAGHIHTDFMVLNKAIESGVLPDTISTDITRASAFMRGGRYGMTMCMTIASVLGMKEEDIFRAVTSAPAKVLKKQDEWGYLRVGRPADIAVFDYNEIPFSLTDKAKNTVSSQRGYRCALTVIDGQVVYRD